MSRQSQIAEIQVPHACGTSETPERSSGMETICGTQTIFEMEIIACGVTGKDTFSLSAQGIGIATGIVTVTIGGMVIDAPSLMDRG